VRATQRSAGLAGGSRGRNLDSAPVRASEGQESHRDPRLPQGHVGSGAGADTDVAPALTPVLVPSVRSKANFVPPMTTPVDPPDASGTTPPRGDAAVMATSPPALPAEVDQAQRAARHIPCRPMWRTRVCANGSVRAWTPQRFSDAARAALRPVARHPCPRCRDGHQMVTARTDGHD
jgi:hypothetical protein